MCHSDRFGTKAGGAVGGVAIGGGVPFDATQLPYGFKGGERQARAKPARVPPSNTARPSEHYRLGRETRVRHPHHRHEPAAAAAAAAAASVASAPLLVGVPRHDDDEVCSGMHRMLGKSLNLQQRYLHLHSLRAHADRTAALGGAAAATTAATLRPPPGTRRTIAESFACETTAGRRPKTAAERSGFPSGLAHHTLGRPA